MWEKVIRLGMVGVFVLLVGCESDENEPEVLGGAADTEMKSAPTAPPPTEEPMPSVTAQQLHDEREANATRYDAQYKGNWVRIRGQVTKIDGGDVFLGADGFLNNVRLQDLSQEEQIALDKGDTVTATCRVGNYILGSIFLEGCELHPTEMSPPTAEPTAAPQPSPTSAPVVSPPTATPQDTAAPILPTSTPPPTPTPTPTPAPKLSLEPGMYKVGNDIEPGIYVGETGIDIFESCYWARLADASGDFDSIISNDNAIGHFYIEVQPTDEYLKFDCEITPIEDWPVPSESLTQIGPGTYIVGRDIAPGTYRGKAGSDVLDSCYWARLSGLSGDFDDIIANENANGSYYMTVASTDFALTTGCDLELAE